MPHRSRQLVVVADGGDRGELLLQRRTAPGLDRGFIHETCVVIADLAQIRAGGRIRLFRLFQNVPDLGLGLLIQYVPNAPVGMIPGNHGALDPRAVGIVIEVVARLTAPSMPAVSKP